MKIFVYGSLMNHPTLSKVLHHLPKTDKALLPGYQETKFKDMPTLQKKKGVIEGQVFEVDDKDVAKLDQWESHYVRHGVTLADDSLAYAYIIDPTTFR